jgi:hypothetical protein
MVVGFGVVCLLAALAGMFYAIRDWSYTLMTEGVVVAGDEEWSDQPDDDTLREYRVRYTVDGMDYFARIGHRECRGYRRNDKMVVWCSPSQPERATVDEPRREQGLLMFVVGLTLLVSCVFPAWVGFKPNKHRT